MAENGRQRADRLFSELLDRPAAEREDFLRAACAGDVELETELRRLLEMALADDDFLAPGGGLRGPLWDEMAAEREPGGQDLGGRLVGEYRLIREIGRGGMGTIYLARKEDGGEGPPVALKLLRTSSELPHVVTRFAQERRILASLDHPGIARHLGGGVSEDGRPYFVMEYIDGLPIDAYCDEHRLTVEERLRLFIDVARAVEYAHRSMVVHRDLKPSNILVTADREVKLLDFGIARVLDAVPELDGEALTRTGLRVMTPEYASPEQVLGQNITTASDVYQLGLILYELLTGARPYRARGRTAGELERVICEQPVALPSAAVLCGGEKDDAAAPPRGPGLAAGRDWRSRPDRLRRRLSGDLDTIVMMALRKEPERRYSSVERLLRDVEHHLEGRPISARKDTVGYRLLKLVRRRPGRVAAVGMMLLLVAALVGLAVERQVAEHRRMQHEAERAQQIAAFLEDLFNIEERSAAEKAALSARELLDRGAARLQSTLADQPQMRAELQNLLGEMYRKLGAYEASEEMLVAALALRHELYGESHREVASSLHSLGRLASDLGRYDEAEEHLTGAARMLQSTTGEDDAELVSCRIDLANLDVARGRFDRAEELFLWALSRLDAKRERGDPDLARALIGLSSLYWAEGRYDDAEPLLVQARAVYELTPESDRHALAGILGNLGRLAARRGTVDEAEGLLVSSRALLVASLGAEHPEAAMALVDQGRLLAEQGRFEEAEELLLDALRTLQAAYGGDHPDIGECLNDLALLYWDQGELDRAEPLLERALSIGRATLGDDHPDVAAAYNSLGALYFRQGKAVQAEQAYRHALAIMESGLGPEHPYLAAVLVNLAAVLRELGRQDEAIPMCRRAVAINEGALGAEHVDVARSRSTLAALLADRGEYAEAQVLLGQALPVFEEAFGDQHGTVALALVRRCAVARQLASADAVELCARALEVGEKVLGPDHPELEAIAVSSSPRR